MQFSVSLKSLSLGLGILGMSAVAASAQSLSGVTARLVTPLNSQTATVGQPITAKLDGSVKMANDVTLPRGTQLLGDISAVKTAQGHTPASITVVFTTAELKDGKKVPVKATLLGAYSPGGELDADSGYRNVDLAPAQVGAQYAVDQEPGALSGITLNAAVSNANSGTFSKNSGNFKLAPGSYLQIGVAAAETPNATSAAE